MSLLLYGIVFAGPRHGFEPLPPVLPLGVGDAPVRLIEASGLGAAVSRIDLPEVTPSVRRALAYAEVVEALHADRTVLPLRYGCVLARESDVVELLRTQSGTYAEWLRGVDGCVEMGVRFPTAERGSSGNGDCGVKSAGWRSDVSGPFSGMEYLDRRKTFYAARERRAHEVARSVQRLRVALAGLFLRCKTEHCAALEAVLAAAAERPPSNEDSPRPTSRVSVVGLRRSFLTLHFLVKREGLPSFRAAVLRIDLTQRAPLLLSGPWPPYNFAVPDLNK